jgi:hypothetical protein
VDVLWSRTSRRPHRGAIKTIPLSRLEAGRRLTLSECADSGQAFVVELPGYGSIHSAIGRAERPAGSTGVKAV